MKVDNIEISGMESAIKASGYPMREFIDTIAIGDNDMKRAKSLSKTKDGGHDQFLTGILVSFDLTCSNKMWVEVERYRFITFVSSQSTMHRISKMDISEMCNQYVNPVIIDICEGLKEKYNESKSTDDYLRLLYNIPSVIELTARLTTNYRCLKNVYHQRKNHRLPEWREFCKWIETLPNSEFITGGEKC